MSYSSAVSLTCERCSTTFEGTIWQSVNADVDPNLREKLINRELMKFTCSGCGLEAFVPYDLLYHDMKRKFIVWLIHSENQRQQLLKDPLDEEFQMMVGYKFRLVGSYNQLLEKIKIFESALDDIVIEFNKNMILEKEDSKDIDLQREDIYYSHLNVYKDLIFVGLLRGDTGTQKLLLRKQDYLDKLNNLDKFLGDLKTKDPCWMIVDHNFTITYAGAWQENKIQPKSKLPGLLKILQRGR